ncbi:hypothetical protein BJX99DRAFT_165543 [Aspergillus californicus]
MIDPDTISLEEEGFDDGSIDTQPISPTDTNENLPSESAFLPQRTYVLYLVTLYSGLAISAWTIQCVLVSRPITAPSYNFRPQTGLSTMADCFRRSDQWYQAARAITAIVNLFTIPLASTVCSLAAVNYIQFGKGRATLTLRQTLALADKGWTNPSTLFRLGNPGLAKKYSSSFLWLAVLVHILGVLIAPLQQILISQETVKVPQPAMYFQNTSRRITDIPRLVDDEALSFYDLGTTTAMLRTALESARAIDYHHHLWQGQESECASKADIEHSVFECMSSSVSGDNRTLVLGGDNSTLVLGGAYRESPDFFLAQLPAGFNTGMLKQFAPRINSSVHWESIQRHQFPSSCTQGKSFFRNYTRLSPSEYGDLGFSVSVCMPGPLNHPPFKDIRDRQDIEENLYISEDSYGTIKITLKTTIGYFELPNSQLGSMPGPLLQDDPLPSCHITDCVSQVQPYSPNPLIDNPVLDGTDLNGNFSLELVPVKGPLALIALALFGSNSFIELRSSPERDEAAFQVETAFTGRCVGFGPLMLLIDEESCDSSMGAIDSVSHWLDLFLSSPKTRAALNTAAFLANEVMLTQNFGSNEQYLTVFSDPGVEMQKPKISVASITVLSALLAVYLIILLGIASWGSFRIGWVGSLDAHAMSRITASLISSMPEASEEKADILDSLPGFIGDAEPDAPVGRLALGAMAPLRRKRRYKTALDLGI